MFLRNFAGGCSAPGGFFWEKPGSVVEVPDALGNELLRIGSDFEEADGPAEDPSEPEQEQEPTGEDEVPDGTATQVLDWVGDSAERASRALETERARGTAARSTLIDKLEKLAH